MKRMSEVKFQLKRKVRNQEIIYIDELDFIKKYKGLRRICPSAFKHLCFEYFPKGIYTTKDGEYEYEVPTSQEFKLLFGQIKLIYSVNKGVIIVRDLIPSEIFLKNYYGDIETYKGMPCYSDKDKFKINLLIKMKEIR